MITFKFNDIIKYLILLIIIFFIGSCLAYFYKKEEYYLPRNSPNSAIGHCILTAGTHQGWRVKHIRSSTYTAEVEPKDSFFIKINLHVIEQRKIITEYVESRNLMYDGENIHRSYYKWVDNYMAYTKRCLSKLRKANRKKK
ncbi:MAG: hypothetical protein OEZ13_06890 [Spirochaetia bacterium]|nr:hypothetical protein [Spirochaetia bacterium]